MNVFYTILRTCYTIENVQRKTPLMAGAIASGRGKRYYNRSVTDLKGSNLAEKVFGHVVENIRNGTFLPAAKLTEAALASQLGVSHVPVREAMERLQQLGWIKRIPKRGAFVNHFDTEEIEKLYQFREIIEVGAIRLVAEKITPEQLGQLKQELDLLFKTEQNDIKAFEAADNRFHQLMVRFAGIDRLDSIFESVILQARCFFYLGAALTGPRTRRIKDKLVPADHQDIYNALAAHDAKAAERLIRKHVRVGCEVSTTISKINELVSS